MAGDAEVPAWPSEPPPAGSVLVAPEGSYAEWAASMLAAWTREAAEAGTDPVSLALAGGSTPRPVYESLAAAADVPWDRLEIFFGDERAVRPEDPESNYRMAKESVLDRVPIREGRVHRMKAEEKQDVSVRDYARLLPQALDIVLLGIGTDGHTASLFPGADALHSRAVVAPSTAPSRPCRRLTLTPPVLARAHRLVVLARGAAKAGPVAEALVGPWNPPACPAQLARRGTWLLDAASAAELPGEWRGA